MTTTLSERRHTLNGLLAGHVCTHCNSGWMGDMEGQIKQFLPELIAGESGPSTMTAARRLLLARWVAKTAFVLNDSQRYEYRVPGEHAKHLNDVTDDLPPRVIALCLVNPIPISYYWWQQPTWPPFVAYHISAQESDAAHGRSYKIAFQFGHIMLMVCWWPDDRFQYTSTVDLVGTTILWPYNLRLKRSQPAAPLPPGLTEVFGLNPRFFDFVYHVGVVESDAR